MVAMLEEVVQFGTGVRAKDLGRPSAGKTGTTNDFTDAWYIGFTPQLTAGVWVGNDDKRISLGKKETGARAALPIWLEFMQGAVQGTPVEEFPNVVPLEKLATGKQIQVDVADTAPPADAAEQGLTETRAAAPPPKPKKPGSPITSLSPNAAPASSAPIAAETSPRTQSSPQPTHASIPNSPHD
jgi:penicillin-binding protein 1A